MAHLLVFLLVAEVSIRGIHYSTFPLLFVIVMEALGRMITRAVSGGYLKFPLTIWVASRQEPCSSIGWHLLVFSIETSKVQIPPPPTIELSKNLRGESFLFSLWMIHIFTLSRMMIHWMRSHMDSGGWNEFQQCWWKEPIVDNIIYGGNET